MTMSKISSYFPESIQSFIEDKEKWNEGIKKASTPDLLKTINEIFDRADPKKSSKPHTFASHAIQELNCRKLDSKEEKKTFNKINKLVKKKNLFCNVKDHYTAESSGVTVKTKGKEKTAHVYGSKVKEDHKQWEKSKTSKTFREYLAEHTTEKAEKKLKKTQVKYLTKEEAERYSLDFKKDGAVTQNKKALENGTYMFVLPLNARKLYVGKKEKGYLHHSSFTAGAAVACAGNIIIKDSKLLYAKLDSGHYRPTKKDGEKLREYLSEKDHLGKKAAKEFQIFAHGEKPKKEGVVKKTVNAVKNTGKKILKALHIVK